MVVVADADGWVVDCCGTAPSDVLDDKEDDGGTPTKRTLRSEGIVGDDEDLVDVSSGRTGQAIGRTVWGAAGDGRDWETG